MSDFLSMSQHPFDSNEVHQEIESLRLRESQHKTEIHVLRQRVASITRECEGLRAELAAIKETVPYRVEDVNPGVSVDASPVVRHFDMTKPEPEE